MELNGIWSVAVYIWWLTIELKVGNDSKWQSHPCHFEWNWNAQFSLFLLGIFGQSLYKHPLVRCFKVNRIYKRVFVAHPQKKLSSSIKTFIV